MSTYIADVPVIGHDSVISELKSNLPPVSIFLGPRSVGKYTAVRHLAGAYSILDSDFSYYSSLEIDDVREISQIALRAPNGSRQFIVLEVEGARREALDALLIPLEEVKEGIHFFILSESRLPLPLRSRGQVFRFSLLSEEDMNEVLKIVLSESANTQRLAKASGGQVFRAFQASKLSIPRSHVIQALQAFKSLDPTPLDSLAKEWSDDHTVMLETWCQEMITGRWRHFEASDVGISDRRLAIRILLALRGGVRPRLVVRSKLMDIWKEYTS